jgi:hypothetical protein
MLVIDAHRNEPAPAADDAAMHHVFDANIHHERRGAEHLAGTSNRAAGLPTILLIRRFRSACPVSEIVRMLVPADL